jgi:transposase-like protein
LFQCNACRRQTSLIAGTIFASTHVPLRQWFRAMYHLTQSKQGISSVELGRRLGVTQTTAWKIKHKLAQVMMERDAGKQLSGRVELDDAYLGGERTGGKRGRGAPGKTPFVAAVETTPEGKPVRLKLRRVASFCNHAISIFAKRSLDPSCAVVSDGLACFGAVTKAGCTHEVIITGSGAAAARTPGFKWVNTALGNIKAAIAGTYRAIDQKHVPRYLAEFEYRFNRRYDLAAMMPRLVLLQRLASVTGDPRVERNRASGGRPEQPGDEYRLSPDVAATDVPNLPLPDHRHCLVTRQCSSRRPKTAKAQPRVGQPFHAPMVLFHDIVQVFHLSQSSGVSLNPSEDRGVIDLHATIQQHQLEIAVADREHQIPSHRPQDHLGGELAAFESLILPDCCGSSLSAHVTASTRADRQHKDATEPSSIA